MILKTEIVELISKNERWLFGGKKLDHPLTIYFKNNVCVFVYVE